MHMSQIERVLGLSKGCQSLAFPRVKGPSLEEIRPYWATISNLNKCNCYGGAPILL